MHRGLLATVIAAIAASSGVGSVDSHLGGFGSCGAAMAADDYQQGVSLFKARDYKNAAAAFRKAIFDRPGDANCFYYYALSLHYAKDYPGAKLAYLEIISRYPSSDAASRAQQGLNAIAPGLLASAGAASPRSSSSAAPAGRVQSYNGRAGVSSDSGSTNGDIIPASSSVNFEPLNGHMVVEVSFNGHRTKAYFDTGAETILMGKNHLAEMGLPAPRGPVVNQSRGVDGQLSDLQEEHMDVTVGGVTRKNIAVHIQDHMDTLPLLGLPFVKGLNYTIETSSIRFSAKQSAVASSATSSRGTDYNAIPYTMQGRTMVVHAQVNGKDTPMCLDTGAAGCLFTRAQAAGLGITVSDDSEAQVGSGVGGAVMVRYAIANSINVGPVQRRDFKVGINELSHSPYPLLGADFWEGRRLTVDEDRHVIHFN